MGRYTQRLADRFNKKSPMNTGHAVGAKPILTSGRFAAHRPWTKEEPEAPVRPTAESTHLMNGEYFPKESWPKDKGFWGGACNRSQCLRPGAKWYNFGACAYYCEPCAHMLSHDDFNFQDSQRTWGKGKLLCEFQPTAEALPEREWLK